MVTSQGLLILKLIWVSWRPRHRVQAYSLTSAPIAKALTDAKARGVDMVSIPDKSRRSERYTSATFLANHAVRVWIDAKHAIAHNKVIVIDEQIVITGPFNFHQGGRREECRDPANHPRHGPGRAAPGQFRRAPEALRAI